MTFHPDTIEGCKSILFLDKAATIAELEKAEYCRRAMDFWKVTLPNGRVFSVFTSEHYQGPSYE